SCCLDATKISGGCGRSFAPSLTSRFVGARRDVRRTTRLMNPIVRVRSGLLASASVEQAPWPWKEQRSVREAAARDKWFGYWLLRDEAAGKCQPGEHGCRRLEEL